MIISCFLIIKDIDLEVYIKEKICYCLWDNDNILRGRMWFSGRLFVWCV